MGASILSSNFHPIHNLLRSSFSSLLSKPSAAAAASASSVTFFTPRFLKSKPHYSIFSPRIFPFHSRSLPISSSVSISDSSKPELFVEDDDDDDDDEIEEDLGIGETVADVPEIGGVLSPVNGREVEIPSLTVKEKKELASYAHSLGKKLKSQLVGKSGVTPNLAVSFVETLEANELLKIKIHRTCPGELEDAVRQLEQLTGSVAVSKIGRTIIIYRPSITKMKAEEKRRQARKLFVRKEPDRVKTLLQNKVETPRMSNRGRRGSSRV